MKLRREKREAAEKVLDVDASMQGTLTFKDSVNLRISGRFEGTLITKGHLMIGEHAEVTADITGEIIIIAGKVRGKVVAERELKLIAPALVIGDVKTPLLSVAEGAVLDGRCHMLAGASRNVPGENTIMSPEDLAKYLEVDQTLVHEWANAGRLPGKKDGEMWMFERSTIDAWVADGKIK